MLQINYLYDNIHRREIKLIILILLSLLFTVIYFFIPDSEFGGINKFQELLREELIKKKIIDKIEPTERIEHFNDYSFKYNYNNNIKLNAIQEEADSVQNLDLKTEKELNKKTFETTKLLKETDFKSPRYSIYQKLFDRLYFSLVTGTTLGYGDVYPTSNRTKLLAVMQLLITISLILL